MRDAREAYLGVRSEVEESLRKREPNAVFGAHKRSTRCRFVSVELIFGGFCADRERLTLV